MSGSLFSPDWYRVAGLRLRLRPRAALHRRVMRGEIWHLLRDHESGRYYRLSPAGRLLVCLLDGRRTVREAWEQVGRRYGAEQPSRDEAILLHAQLHRADLLMGEIPPDVGEVARRAEAHRRQSALSRLRNPLALRLPLFDPDRFLTATAPLARPLFSAPGFALWLALVVAGIAAAAAHWDELTGDLVDRVFSLRSLALTALCYPLVKAAHQLGHGYACKRSGGAAHEMGVMLLALFPAPYVDASDATAFERTWRRALVGGAGIMVEMALAAAAMLIWTAASPGMVRAVAFNVMLIGGVSTLLFNGNPLLRFDGYYVLSDLLGIPNLARRSNQYAAYLIRRHLFGENAPNPAQTAGEARWLIGYALAANACRVALTFAVALALASRYLAIGAMLGAWSVASLVIWPLAKGAVYVARAPRRGRAALAATALVSLPALALFAAPVPYATLAQGVVRLPEDAMVRPRVDGIVSRLLVEPGAAVRRGEGILELDAPALAPALAVLEAEARELALRRDAALASDRVAGLIGEQVGRHVVRAMAARRLGFEPHVTQLMGALTLWRGAVAEMATGEGKTATAALCAAAAALAGRSAHIVTANDYLAARDAATMAPLFESLGLRAAAVVGGMAREARRDAYAGEIVYGAAKESRSTTCATGSRREPAAASCAPASRRRAAAARTS
jgi:putative peptide zinc metalloprotease protein